MLNIKVICLGNIKEKSMKDILAEYEKRLSKYCKLDIIEISDEKVPSSLSDSDIKNIKEIESKKIIDKINKIGKAYVIALDLTGKQITSEDFSKKISDIATYDSSTIVFLIGGTLGMSNELLDICNEKISFSKFTFPHQLIRIFLLEQVFRAFKIQNNETYHH